MGIQGLLPLIKKACRPANVSEFKNQTVAVDTSCWLHKGGFGCADKLAKGEQTDFYVHYCMKYVKMLLAHNIHVILVFDGISLPAKKDTDAQRKQRRKQLKQKGLRLVSEGRDTEARECFKQCVELTSEMISSVIYACRSLPNVDCMVSPYESDAQLAYLQKSGIAQLIITEDSDLVPFGCDQVLYKMDAMGLGMLYEKRKLSMCLGVVEEKFSFEKFRRICIMSGCDYLNSLPGIGLAKATKFFASTSSNDLQRILPKIPTYLRMQLKVEQEYVKGFIEADNTFLYQLVFDPLTKSLVPLTPYCPPLNAEMLPYCGALIKNSVAYEIVLGILHPYTHQRMSTFEPKDLRRDSIFHAAYRKQKLSVDSDDDDFLPSKRNASAVTAFALTTDVKEVKAKKSETQNSSPHSNLRRSTTFDLLDQYHGNEFNVAKHLCAQKTLQGEISSHYFSRRTKAELSEEQQSEVEVVMVDTSPEKRHPLSPQKQPVIVDDSKGHHVSGGFLTSLDEGCGSTIVAKCVSAASPSSRFTALKAFEESAHTCDEKICDNGCSQSPTQGVSHVTPLAAKATQPRRSLSIGLKRPQPRESGQSTLDDCLTKVPRRMSLSQESNVGSQASSENAHGTVKDTGAVNNMAKCRSFGLSRIVKPSQSQGTHADTAAQHSVSQTLKQFIYPGKQLKF